ncbi:MAG: hypothetical protein CSH37_14175 [Thalassolituus sp.]|nr:MAG: hypothetical protein CSH37_14175 [Thalassolituus sp.]
MMNTILPDNELIFIAAFLAVVTFLKVFFGAHWAKNYKKLDDRISGRHALWKRVDDTSHLIDWSRQLDSDFIGFVRTIVSCPQVFSELNRENQVLLLDISVQTDALPSEGQIPNWNPVALRKDIKRVEELKRKYFQKLQPVAEELMKNASSHVNASQTK